MADEANNQEGRMDERSGRGGVAGSSASGLSGSSGAAGGTRTDSGVDNRGSGTVSRKTPRGFAAMDPQAQRAIAAKGGRAAHQKGTAHEFTSEEARIAGRKGGEASRGGRRSNASTESENWPSSRDRERKARIYPRLSFCLVLSISTCCFSSPCATAAHQPGTTIFFFREVDFMGEAVGL